jgi:hypothetical protein
VVGEALDIVRVGSCDYSAARNIRYRNCKRVDGHFGTGANLSQQLTRAHSDSRIDRVHLYSFAS